MGIYAEQMNEVNWSFACDYKFLSQYKVSFITQQSTWQTGSELEGT